MTAVLMLRHAATAWSAVGRLQGRTEVPLSAEGRAELARWRLPGDFAEALLLTSPLVRATATAAHFGSARVEPRLVEMDWGAWEGRRLVELRAADPAGLAALEALGLDLRPPGGERPRDVRERLAGLLGELAGAERAVLVTHKGVLRAALSLATGWDFQGRPPLKLRAGRAWLLRLDGRGRPRPQVHEVALDRAASCVS